MKINANSSYGLTGMSNFLFSNRQLAMSTTLSGRLCLKISQACGELYLKQLEEKYKEHA
jgi:DNA polymerase elongation subunit (family B)